MKVLALAANGEGFGHVARMVSLAPELQREYRVLLYAPTTVHGFLADKLPQVVAGTIPLRALPHLHLAKRGDRIDYWACLTENLPTALRTRSLLAGLRTQMAADGVQLLVSDFEPYSTWAASALGIPVLQVNHPGIVTRSASIAPDALATKWIAEMMMGRWDRRILVSFFDGDLGPMIRPEIVQAPRGDDGSLVVYLKPGYRKPIVRALRSLGITNYHLFPDSSKDYAKTLAGCKAVIAGGGHQTISEAIYLGKPILAIPQRGQYEQRLNAFMAEAGGFGMRARILRLAAQLKRFLAAVEGGAYPRAAALPWVNFDATDNTKRVVRRIRQFAQATEGRRIIPFRGQLIETWLGTETSAKKA